MIICIDFDGTCVTHEFPKVGKDIGAVPVLKRLVESGHEIFLFTMRSNRPISNPTGDETIQDVTGMFVENAVTWFKENGIPLLGINENPTQKNWTISPKAYGHLYIDDSALGCPIKEVHLTTNGDKTTKYVDWVKVERILECMNILPHTTKSSSSTKINLKLSDLQSNLQKYSEIDKELERAEKKHPNFPIDMFRQLAVMQEEAGEVTKAVLHYHYENGTLEHVKEELIQTAAMCMRMLQSLSVL